MGTPATLRFKGKPFLLLYSHYDGYPEEIADKLYDAVKMIKAPESSTVFARQNLLSLFIGANAETVALEDGRNNNDYGEYVYQVDPKGGHIRWGKEQTTTSDDLDQFINRGKLGTLRNIERVARQHQGSIKQFKREEFEPFLAYDKVIQFHAPHGGVREFCYILLSEARKVEKMLKAEIERWGENNPNSAHNRVTIAEIEQCSVADATTEAIQETAQRLIDMWEQAQGGEA